VAWLFNLIHLHDVSCLLPAVLCWTLLLLLAWAALLLLLLLLLPRWLPLPQHTGLPLGHVFWLLHMHKWHTCRGDEHCQHFAGPGVIEKR
jgi:hypothetical protein